MCCVLLNIGYGHESNKAFFNIVQTNDQIVIKAEFPWTIRKALIQFDPNLENASSQEEYLASLKKYVDLNLILKRSNGERIELADLEEKKIAFGHTHQSNFILTYKGNRLSSISNQLLFNINDSQTNYHELIINGQSLQYETTKDNPTFNLPETERPIYWYLIPFFVALTAILYFRKRRA